MHRGSFLHAHNFFTACRVQVNRADQYITANCLVDELGIGQRISKKDYKHVNLKMHLCIDIAGQCDMSRGRFVRSVLNILPVYERASRLSSLQGSTPGKIAPGKIANVRP
jgi:hypothetical protein